MYEATTSIFHVTNMTAIGTFLCLWTLNHRFSSPRQLLIWSCVSVDRSRGPTTRTRSPQDPRDRHRTQSPPWTLPVKIQWRPTTPEVVSTHTHTHIYTLFVHLNCQIVNIRLGVSVYSCYLRLSEYTQYVCQPMCACACMLMCVCDRYTAGYPATASDIVLCFFIFRSL